MNTSKLHRALNEGRLDIFVRSLSELEKKRLISVLKWEIISYKDFCKNYSPEKYEEYAVPYFKKREGLKKALEDAL